MKETIEKNNNFNVIDLILLDHKYLKECIQVLKDPKADKEDKLSYAKTFLDALRKHSDAEERAVYDTFIHLKEVHLHVLEGQAEHALADIKAKELAAAMTRSFSLTENLEVGLKVLAELVEHHIEEEERDLLPKIKKRLDRSILNEVGYQFMNFRHFTQKDLEDYPELQEELNNFERTTPKLAWQSRNKVHDYINNLEQR